jgi:hypothetical protein
MDFAHLIGYVILAFKHESTATRTAGGLDFTAIGGKRKGREVPQSLKTTRWNRVRSMTIPLYERDGLFFRPQDGKTSER